MGEEDFTVVIAGEEFRIPKGALARYATEGGTARTLRDYDSRANEWKSTLTSGDLALTRRMYSRISNDEATWFLDRASSAPFESVTKKDKLADADPTDGPDGLYWRADRLFNHFREPRQPGVALGKISKVLHLMRPEVFPILDARVVRHYSRYARQVAQDLNTQYRRTYFAAIRLDLVDPVTREGLTAIRTWARAEGGALDRLGGVTDVRLLDIITWTPTVGG